MRRKKTSPLPPSLSHKAMLKGELFSRVDTPLPLSRGDEFSARLTRLSVYSRTDVNNNSYHLLSGRWLNNTYYYMEKLDLAKQYKHYYKAKTKPEIVNIEAAQFLSITGKGDPSSEDYMNRISVLFPVAYTLKFMYKTMGKDFAVAKLEGLWWFDNEQFGNPSIDDAPMQVPRSEWEYRMLIRLPGYVNKEDVQQAIETVVFKKELPLAREVKFFEMKEGKCVQMLHVGPFDTEPETLKQIDAFCTKHGFQQNGLHHEIYLSDFRKTAPEKLKTILREPIAPSAP
jgi:hypothetical protein